MKKGRALVWFIWGAMPILCAFIPASRTWNIFVMSSFGQDTLQNHTIKVPGFWDKLKSKLNTPKSDDTKSDSDSINLVLDSIYSDEIRFTDSLSGLSVSNWDRSQNINTLKNKKNELPLTPSIKVFSFILVVVFAVLAALGVFFYTKPTRKELAMQVHHMKKTISREFKWLLINLVLAIPLTYLFIYFIDLVGEKDALTKNEKDFIAEFYALGYLFIFIGLVLLRIIIMVIKK